MFGIGFQEMLIILVVVLIFFGPKRLPDLAKSLGKGIAEFKKASEEVRRGIEEAVKEESSAESPKPDIPSPADAADVAPYPPASATPASPGTGSATAERDPQKDPPPAAGTGGAATAATPRTG
jgi:TatA/E family protein of Tat protein translocase